MKFMGWFVLGASLIGCSESDPAGGGGGMTDGGSGGSGGSGGGGAEPVSWWTLSGTDAELPDDDLLPLAPLVENASVIGIGESVHTTGGELRMRARMIRFLVEHEGVRVIALENEWDLTERQIAPFIDNCTGTAEEAAMGINAIWWDVSTPALFQWICDFNTAHPADPVRVVGMDIRQAWYDEPAIEAYLQANAPAEADATVAGLATCLGVGFADHIEFFNDPTVRSYFDGTPTPEGDHVACLAGADAATALLAARRAELIAATSEREFERIRVRVVGMRAFDESIYQLSRGNLELGNPPRDAAMADVFMTFRRVDFSEKSAILFAHDGHIMRRSNEAVAGQWVGVKNVGSLIAEELGAGYVAVGQLSQITHIDWFSGPQTIVNDGPNDLEHALAALGVDFALVDTSAAVTLAPTLWTPGQAYDVSFETVLPENNYDVLVFHRESPANTYFTQPPW